MNYKIFSNNYSLSLVALYVITFKKITKHIYFNLKEKQFQYAFRTAQVCLITLEFHKNSKTR